MKGQKALTGREPLKIGDIENACEPILLKPRYRFAVRVYICIYIYIYIYINNM
jgi:hypothetical protein